MSKIFEFDFEELIVEVARSPAFRDKRAIIAQPIDLRAHNAYDEAVRDSHVASRRHRDFLLQSAK